jgi:ubiquinone biosynthesis protein
VDDLAGVLVQQKSRVHEIAEVLRRYGFTRLAFHAGQASGGLGSHPRRLRAGDPNLVAMSTGERLSAALAELGTTWIKFGQMLSLRPDLVGDDVAHELSNLRANVPADQPGRAEATIAASLAKPVAKVFASFDAVPLASGSMAQVHSATLLDGTVVAVKVLHDGAEKQVISDLKLMAALAKSFESVDEELARYAPSSLVAEFATMMLAAIDLGQELKSMQRFTTNFANEPDLVIPEAFPAQSAKHVLTMKMMVGKPFEDRAALEAGGWDVDALTRRASDIYLEMVFRDGFYHADPHPGNFLLPDPGHLVLLDFGDVGYLTANRKSQLEELLVAITNKNVEDVTDAVIEITSAPADVDLPNLQREIDLWMNQYLLGSVAEVDLASMVNSGATILRTFRLTFPTDLALLVRVLLRLQGLSHEVGTSLSLESLLKPYLRQMVLSRFDPQRWAHRALRTARNWERLFSAFPDDFRQVLEQLKDGAASVDFRVRDSDNSIGQLVDGLFASAAVLASTQLLSRRTPPVVRGVSIPGLLGVALALLTWRRLQVRRSNYQPLVKRAVKRYRKLRN